MAHRKVTYRLYPTKGQEQVLSEILRAHQQLYNAALHERIDCYRKTGCSRSYSDQCKALTQLRAEDPQYARLNAQSSQVTLKRLDLAFRHFFRRVKRGEIPGFPRFKSLRRYPGWGYKTHGDGWRLRTGEGMAHGKLRLSGVGNMKLRGKARTPGVPKTCEIQHKGGKWYASVTIACEPARACGTLACGIDWGVETFATVATSDGQLQAITNPRFLRRNLDKLKAKNQALSRTQRGSKNRAKARRRVAALHAKIAHQRRDFLHQITTGVVSKCAAIATEQLNITAMTARGPAQKAGLNREILSTAPGVFLSMLQVKAEEAGAVYVEIPTKQAKPSQTCHACGRRAKKRLGERQHSCACGASCSRDENSALVCLQVLRQELARCPGADALAQETPALSHSDGRE